MHSPIPISLSPVFILKSPAHTAPNPVSNLHTRFHISLLSSLHTNSQSTLPEPVSSLDSGPVQSRNRSSVQYPAKSPIQFPAQPPMQSQFQSKTPLFSQNRRCAALKIFALGAARQVRWFPPTHPCGEGGGGKKSVFLLLVSF